MDVSPRFLFISLQVLWPCDVAITYTSDDTPGSGGAAGASGPAASSGTTTMALDVTALSFHFSPDELHLLLSVSKGERVVS